MRAIKIPNTMHFKDVTKIEDAVRLYDKLKMLPVEAKRYRMLNFDAGLQEDERNWKKDLDDAEKLVLVLEHR